MKRAKKKIQYEDQKFFYEIFKLDKTKGAKIILFIKNPGIYKIIFDNRYSWFNAKLIRYRCTILKEVNNLAISPYNSNDDIKLEKKESTDDINNIDNNKEEEKDNNIKINVKLDNKVNEQDVNLDGDDLNTNKLDDDIK